MADTASFDAADLVNAPPVSVPVEYNQRDLILYAIGIGSADPRYVYEHHPEFAAFPTYPICLTYKGSSYDVSPFPPPATGGILFPSLPGSTVASILDAEKYIEKVAELPSGGKFKLVCKVNGVRNKGRGALCESAYEVQDEQGKVYSRMISSSFLGGAKPIKEAGTMRSMTVAVPTSAPSKVVEVPTDPNIANLFRLSGDYNELHVDPRVAKTAGFDRPILHGLCTLGHITRSMLDVVAGGDQRRYKSVQLRFTAPVEPGDCLIVEMWSVNALEIKFRALVKGSGKVCINNGLLCLTPEARL